MNGFSWLAVLLVGAYDDGDDGVAKDGGHTPNNKLTDMQPLFTLHFFDIGHLRYDLLTPVKTRYPLTSIT